MSQSVSRLMMIHSLLETETMVVKHTRFFLKQAVLAGSASADLHVGIFRPACSRTYFFVVFRLLFLARSDCVYKLYTILDKSIAGPHISRALLDKFVWSSDHYIFSRKVAMS